MKKKDQSILTISIGLLITLFIVIVAFSTKQRDKEDDIVSHVNKSWGMISQLNELHNSVQDHAIAIANYAHASIKDSVTAVQMSAALVSKQLDSLNEIFKKEVGHSPDMDSLNLYVKDRLDLSNQIIASANKNGFDETILLLLRSPGSEYSRRIFSTIGHIEVTEINRLQSDEQDDTNAIKNLRLVLFILRMVVLVLVAIVVRKILLDFALRSKLERQLKNFNKGLQKAVDEKTAEIKKNEERYRMIVEQASDAILINDQEGNFLDVNESACQMLGYSRNEFRQMNVQDLLFPEDLYLFPLMYERLRGGEQTHSERNIRRKDGSAVSIESTAKMLSDGRIIAIIRDVTERKRVDELLRQSEFNNRMVVENKILGVAWASPEGKVMNANNAFCEMLGYSLDEMKGVFFGDFTHPDDVEKELGLVKQMEEGKIDNYLIEKRYKNKKGGYFWVELNLTCRRNSDTNKIDFFVGLVQDIQETKTFEEALKASEKNLRHVLSSTGDIFYVIDKNYTITLLNNVAEKNLSKAWGKTVKLGSNVLELIPKESDDPVRRSFEKVFDGQRVEYELHNVVIKDLPEWVFVTYSPVKDDDGTITGAYVVTKDITKRRKAEEELVQSNNRFELISRTTNDAIWEWNLESDELWSNETHQQLYGLTKKDPVPTEAMWLDRIHPDDRTIMEKRQNEALKSDKNVFISEYRFKAFNKEGYRNIYDRCYIVRNENGKPIRMMGSMVDITERKRSEAEIQKARELSDTMIDSLPGIFYLYDEKGKFIRWNKQFELISEYSGREIAQMHPINFFAGDEVEYITKRIESVFEKGTSDAEANFVTKSNKKIPFYFKAVRIMYEEKPCLLGYGIDVSDKKSAEEELKNSYDQIRRLSDHLQNIREEERSHIAREIHDELGQQLTVLKMDASFLSKRLGSTDNTIRKKLDSLMELLDDTVKTVRRISSELRPSLLDDMGLMAAIEWHLKEFEKRTSIVTKFKSPGEELTLPDTVKTGLFRIVQESLTNVARHSGATTVKVNLKKDNKNIILSISDDGQGFDREKAANKKTLGILGMRERTYMMGGDYQISSSAGKGTLVTVAVPYSEQPSS